MREQPGMRERTTNEGPTTLENGTGLLLGGLVPFSTIDWPGKLAAVVFTRGCPWDCPYCHNPHLLGDGHLGERAGAGAGGLAHALPGVHAGGLPDALADDGAHDQPAPPDLAPDLAPDSPAPTWPDVLALLDARAGLLDGVVFSGGEPTAQRALPQAINAVRERGFAAALHTNGAYPERLRALLPLVDWVGLDIKAPRGAYDRITRRSGSSDRAFESLAALVASHVPYEVRTTVHPDLLGSDNLSRLADELEAANVTHWAIQAYRADGARPGLRPARLGIGDLPERVRAFVGKITFREV